MGRIDQANNGMREDARRIFLKGLEAVEPAAAVNRYCRREAGRLLVGQSTLDLDAFERVFVVGAGKASAPMALALEQILGDRITRGIVNVKYGYTAPVQRIDLVEAGHPLADENGIRGAQQILDLISGAGPDDLVLCLISGGGSALLPLPVESISLADKQETFRVLTECGATIHEMNTIRKHISRIKGGHLAKAAHPATVISLMLSDVVGDDLDVIASGPTVADSSTYRDCFRVLDAYGVRAALPATVVGHLEAGLAGQIPETPKAGDTVFAKTRNLIVGSNIEALVSAEREARRLGYGTLVLSSMIEGETRCVAATHCAIAREILATGHPIDTPACILSGGETTVTIKGRGVGGRNQEFALAAAMGLAGAGPVVVLCAGTDGTDGPTDAAGAFADSGTVARAQALGMDAGDYLAGNDAYHFFKPLGDLLITGPTNTNVMDLRVVLAGSPDPSPSAQRS
jgi:hydroxypyruvate reductase